MQRLEATSAWGEFSSRYRAAKVMLAVLLSVPATVTVAVCVPNRSCHASIVYVPGGRPLIEKLPSGPVTAKNGSERTPAYDFIQPCTLHSRFTITSGAVNVRLVFMPAVGWLTLKGRFFFAMALML